MKNKYLVFFMPSIEGGGVEKNLFIIANYFSSKSNNIKLITASNGFDQKFENIDIIKPEISFLKNTSRKLKYLICLLELLKLIWPCQPIASTRCPLERMYKIVSLTLSHMIGCIPAL